MYKKKIFEKYTNETKNRKILKIIFNVSSSVFKGALNAYWEYLSSHKDENYRDGDSASSQVTGVTPSCGIA